MQQGGASQSSIVAAGLSEWYPRALLQHLAPNGVDTDAITEANYYLLKPSQMLAVGKYVPDEVTAGDEEDNAASASEEGPLSPTTPGADSRVSVYFTDPIASQKGASSSPLFYPIHYPSVTAKDKADPKGLPYAINARLHGPDRPRIPFSKADISAVNLNKLPMYKIGPGAVAFRVVINAMEAAGMKYTPSNDLLNLLWAKRATPEVLAALTPYQKINHFPGTWGIGRKDNLHKNVSRMRKQFGADFDIVPRTFLIPSEAAQLQRDCQSACEAGASEPTYIVKPSASSCGKGILLYKGMPPMPTGTKQMVCQRYVANPMIVHGRKFDLRMYCVVTGFDPLRIYLFDQGLVRFAAEKYPGADQLLDNSYAHLTNYSINKTSALAKQSKGKEADSDEAIDIKWAISDLHEWLEATHGPAKGKEIWATIYQRSKDVVIKTFLSIEADVVSKIRQECKSDPTGSRCFELYGLDLMVDDQYNVTLIEANIMPSLATGSTLDKAVKARMLAHMLTLAGVFPCARDAHEGPDDVLPSWLSPKRYFYREGREGASDETTGIPLATKFDSSGDSHSSLTLGERRMLAMADGEHGRAGGFDRIFPTATTFSQYAPLFSEGFLRSNYVLASWESMKAGAK